MLEIIYEHYLPDTTGLNSYIILTVLQVGIEGYSRLKQFNQVCFKYKRVFFETAH